MNDAFGVRRIQGIGNLDAQVQQLIRSYGAVLDSVLQGLPFQVLHDDEGLAFVIADVVDGADVGMIECRGRSGLPLETIQCLFVLGKLFRQKFQGHIAAQAGVLSLVDHTHPTATQFLCDFVVGDGLADHGVGTRRLSSSNQLRTTLIWSCCPSSSLIIKNRCPSGEMS